MKVRFIEVVSTKLVRRYKYGGELTLTNLPIGADLSSYSDLVDLLDPVLGRMISTGIYDVYNTEDGKPQPGDMFWQDYPKEYSQWENEEGRHLMVVLPNGIQWDIDSRARNCTLKADKTHRCWIRTGEPPNITVHKNGHTCAAGAGSIQAGDYHGFLTNGELIK